MRKKASQAIELAVVELGLEPDLLVDADFGRQDVARDILEERIVRLEDVGVAVIDRGPLRDVEHDAAIGREHGVLVEHLLPVDLRLVPAVAPAEDDVHRLERIEARCGEGAVLQRGGGTVGAVHDPWQCVRTGHVKWIVVIDVDPLHGVDGLGVTGRPQ